MVRKSFSFALCIVVRQGTRLQGNLARSDVPSRRGSYGSNGDKWAFLTSFGLTTSVYMVIVVCRFKRLQVGSRLERRGKPVWSQLGGFHKMLFGLSRVRCHIFSPNVNESFNRSINTYMNQPITSFSNLLLQWTLPTSTDASVCLVTWAPWSSSAPLSA